MGNVAKWPSHENNNPKVEIEVCYTKDEVSDMYDIINKLGQEYANSTTRASQEIEDTLENVKDLLDIIYNNL